ncbi:hypothetical protein ACTOB_003305 [Actinoplanes oblitus]|uniref:Transposase IS701-like DDE domain-containing protein n=1 Tax=Actinoplanes oblitus TaxID=3040509 RepID=A0ABY8WUQ7_9ACTN|nr:hypothetical protein [Actinoplanes oblitus]WIM99645.1 hypothetical protein ACTOB_003305 [Actinoplanes oblitus]
MIAAYPPRTRSNDGSTAYLTGRTRVGDRVGGFRPLGHGENRGGVIAMSGRKCGYLPVAVHTDPRLTTAHQPVVAAVLGGRELAEHHRTVRCDGTGLRDSGEARVSSATMSPRGRREADLAVPAAPA